MKLPIKPFDTYKWRWLSVQPSEGLLEAPVFLGVLRVLARFEGEKYSSQPLFEQLLGVEQETESSVTLARDPIRNLFRNSGQYWRGTGLILPTKGTIELTDLGKMVANGDMTRDEFAALMVRNTVLPNKLTYSTEEVLKWENHRIKIKPLELILEILTNLNQTEGHAEGYLLSDELIKIVIPLVGAKEPINIISAALISHRRKTLDVSNWPDCAPESNDKRLAREFLLFLKNFEILSVSNPDSPNAEQRFTLDDANYTPIENQFELSQIIQNSNILDQEINTLRQSTIPDIIDRTRTTISVIRRQKQSAFRKDVLKSFSNKCLLSNEQLPDVLEAAHIIPVNNGGSDIVDNGLCLRVDLHRLYDAGKIRILSNGQINYHKQVNSAISYRYLPKQIHLPSEVSHSNLVWRERYL